jgi:glycosyltransferase involved in cell wall biosynthesis
MSHFHARVSVIIPTRNEEQVIHECLSSVFGQSLTPYEVIVIDGRSTDDTLKKARRFPVEILIEEEPTSLPNARNIGIENAKGDLLLIMDADTVLDRDCLEHAVKYFQEPKVFAVIPSLEMKTHTRLEEIQAKWLHGTSNPLRMGIEISTFAEFFRKEVFKNVRFDPDLGYGEDEDFQQRFKRVYKGAGKIIHAYDCKISVHHPHTFKELRSQWTWWGRTFTRYLSKHASVRTILILGSVLAPTILLVLGFLTLFFAPAFPFLVLVFAMLVARTLIACYRSKSINFVEFIAFEFIRSFFFVIGVAQGFFSNEKGK